MTTALGPAESGESERNERLELCCAGTGGSALRQPLVGGLTSSTWTDLVARFAYSAAHGSIVSARWRLKSALPNLEGWPQRAFEPSVM
jgi:hypothetical protein